MKKKWIAVLLVSALAAAAAAGCGQSGESQGADSQGAQGTSAQGQQSAEGGERDELVFVNYRDIRDLNPHLYAGEMYAQSILYDTLVSTTAEGYPSVRTDGSTPSISGTTCCSRTAPPVTPTPFWPTLTPLSKTRTGTHGWR